MARAQRKTKKVKTYVEKTMVVLDLEVEEAMALRWAMEQMRTRALYDPDQAGGTSGHLNVIEAVLGNAVRGTM